MFKKIEIWILYLVILLSLLFAIGFGVLVRQEIEGITKEGSIDTQKSTTFYKVKDKKFIKGNDLNYPRWYGSIIRTEDDEFVMVGGEEIVSGTKSITPEILKRHSDGDWYWKTLENATSNDLFGDVVADEWNYPRSFLASDGNIFGISYNKMWVMEKKVNNYDNIKKVGEIPLVSRAGVSGEIVDTNPNTGETKKLRLLFFEGPRT